MDYVLLRLRSFAPASLTREYKNTARATTWPRKVNLWWARRPRRLLY